MLNEDCPVAVVNIEMVKAKNIRNYRPEHLRDEEKYMRVDLISHAYMTEVRKIFE